MPLTVPGADLQLARGVTSGKFDIQWDASGNPIFTDDQSHAVVSLIMEHRGEYWGDPTGIRGSYIWTVKNLRKSTPSQIIVFIQDALQPLLDNGKILNLKVTASKDAFNAGRVNVAVNYSLPGGGVVTLRPGLGY